MCVLSVEGGIERRRVIKGPRQVPRRARIGLGAPESRKKEYFLGGRILSVSVDSAAPLLPLLVKLKVCRIGALSDWRGSGLLCCDAPAVVRLRLYNGACAGEVL